MWPRTIAALECPGCKKELPVIQTAYGARAICEDCRIRWTTLFSEEGAWINESYSPLSDNRG